MRGTIAHSARLAAAAIMTASLLVLGGCATYVHVDSDPEGALITDPSGTIKYGTAPVDVEFATSDLEAKMGQISGFKATWPSGTEAQTASPMVIEDLRYGASVMLKRPDDAPGLEIDLKHALEQAQRRAKEAEAERDRMELYLDHGWWWRPHWGWGIGF